MFLFENDVKTYGTETTGSGMAHNNMFENDVKTCGTETQIRQLQYPLVTTCPNDSPTRTFLVSVTVSVRPSVFR